MPSILDIKSQNKNKKINLESDSINQEQKLQVQDQQRTIGASSGAAASVIDNYLDLYSPEGALKSSISSLDGFCTFWQEQVTNRDNLSKPEDYFHKVNTIFTSYSTLRSSMDSTIAYLIGDMLVDCRERFFPNEDRKTKGLWASFLKKNLCKTFERSTAYDFIAIAEKLKEFRGQKLKINTLKALVRAKNAGLDLKTIDIDNSTTSELLSLSKRKSDKTYLDEIVKCRKSIQSLISKEHLIELSDEALTELILLKQEISSLSKIVESYNLSKN